MRPAALFPLFKSVSSIKGVGPAMQAALTKLLWRKPVIDQAGSNEPVIRDLLFHLPTGLVDRRTMMVSDQVEDKSIYTGIVTVLKHYPPPPIRGRRPPYRIQCRDDGGDLWLIFFSAKADYLSKTLPEGQERVISGEIERYDGKIQMTHPDMITTPERLSEVARLQPTYALTHGVGQKQLGKMIAQSLQFIPALDEWIEPALLSRQQWPAWDAAIRSLHTPQDSEVMSPLNKARERLAYDEMLAHQLALAVVRKRVIKQSGIVIAPHSALRKKLEAALPFVLTGGQKKVMAEIDADMSGGQRMLRLLQGDVGSGKTVVSLMAMMPILELGYQVALMVPTEILGRQHLISISKMVASLGIHVGMLSGKMSAADRKASLAAMADGRMQIVVGTHALFQENVSFHKLGLVIVDEQHRFGVNQRLALSAKGDKPHILLMTATPIPRSLTMTAYGDMESSLLTEKPANRSKIQTRAVSLDRIDEVIDGLKRAIAGGSKIYWICPLVEEMSEETAKAFEGDLAAAEERYRVFQSIFGDRVALMHGKMDMPSRTKAMEGFAGDDYDILVATTVVEVGVDVPDATIIVIEHAERFGLAQLHQLRGRVGRGDKPSSCILLYRSKCSEIAKRRLQVIRESDDGFYIAEEDLVLRGAGDVLGVRQSGLPHFRFLDLINHRDLIALARSDVKYLLAQDAALDSERGKALRSLLYLFDYDASLQYLQAG